LFVFFFKSNSRQQAKQVKNLDGDLPHSEINITANNAPMRNAPAKRHQPVGIVLQLTAKMALQRAMRLQSGKSQDRSCGCMQTPPSAGDYAR